MRSFEMDLAFVRVLADLVEAVEPPREDVVELNDAPSTNRSESRHVEHDRECDDRQGGYSTHPL